MNMRAKRSVKPMRGFMCQPQSSTALCMAGDGRSVIVPRRTLVEHDTLVKAVKYSRLTGPAKKTSTLKPPSNLNQVHKKQSPVLQNSSSPVFQVVVMRVSIHCEGCAGKVKKHLSKMAGVTSFSIDLEDKRVTVMGHVSPVGVLESISKVKKAEFWTSCDSNEESQDEKSF